MSEKPHQSALRKGRYSEPGLVYSIVDCIEDRQNLLVPDPYQPLADPVSANIVIDAIRLSHEQERWTCYGYTVMPDHIHLVIKLGEDKGLSDTIQSFGNFTALRVNRHHSRSGRCWQKTFYDRMVRDDDDELYDQLNYVYENPVRKGFVEKPEDWPFSAIYPEW